MPKGLLTQTFCLLTNGHASIGDIKSSVLQRGFEVSREIPAGADLQFGGPSIVIPYRPDMNGCVAVDVVNQPWPDTMGHPQDDPMTFGAWGMGQFGPFTFPGGLERAVQNAWGAPECKSLVAQHQGYIRFRMSYVFGAGLSALMMPAGCDAVAELVFLNRLIDAACLVPNVLCYFNPNGEVLRDARQFGATLRGCEEQGRLPLLLWTNVRMYDLNESLLFMDTVGNEQFDRPDVEAVFSKTSYEPDDVAHYLRNVTHYLLDSKREIKSGESIDGPGESGLSWTIESSEKPVVAPPRNVLRLYHRSVASEVRGALPTT